MNDPLPPARSRRPPPAPAIAEICAPWDRQDSPGCVVAVVSHGEVLCCRGYGMADLERGTALAPCSVFDIGSLAKQFTAVAAALLAEEGKLVLDDDVRDHVPETRQYGERITVRHLVHHTSGLRDYLDLLALAGRRHLGASTAEVLALLERQRGLNFVPGAEFRYSNSGYVLLAAVVARAAGCSLADYAEGAIFRPLGMSNTRFEEGGREGGGGLALAYSPLASGGFTVDAAGVNLAGDGALLTTAEDLCRWERNFYDNRLGAGGPELMRQAATPGRLDSGETLDYAWGLFLGKLGSHPLLYHGGTFAAYRAGLVRCPDERLSVLCLANLATVDAERVARRIAGLCLGEDELPPQPEEEAAGPERQEPGEEPGEAAAAAPTPRELDGYAGCYACDELDVAHQIHHQEGQLLIRMQAIPFPLPLTPTTRDEFTAQGGVVSVRFQRDPARRISGFIVSSPGVQGLRFTGPGPAGPAPAESGA
jgi:CubicO group peptidase (beta-lactamase class C family)